MSIICGNVGPYEHDLAPGGFASEIFYLNPSYLFIPSGTAAISLGWNVYRIINKSGDKDRQERQLDLLFDLKATQSVDVLPGDCPDLISNVARAAISEAKKRREAEYKEKRKTDK